MSDCNRTDCDHGHSGDLVSALIIVFILMVVLIGSAKESFNCKNNNIAPIGSN